MNNNSNHPIMTDLEHDKILIRSIFNQFEEMSKQEFKTDVGQEIGRGIKVAVKVIKPYMIELSKQLTNK